MIISTIFADEILHGQLSSINHRTTGGVMNQPSLTFQCFCHFYLLPGCILLVLPSYLSRMRLSCLATLKEEITKLFLVSTLWWNKLARLTNVKYFHPIHFFRTRQPSVAGHLTSRVSSQALPINARQERSRLFPRSNTLAYCARVASHAAKTF
jgi:hypothetical protein